MGNLIVILIIGLIVGVSIWKVVSEKKKGVKCIGCPHGKSCSSSCGGYDLNLKK